MHWTSTIPIKITSGLPWALLSEIVYQIKFAFNQQKGIMAHFEHYISLTDLKWLILWFVYGMHKLYYAMYMIADPDARFGEGYQYRNGIFKSINVLLTFSKKIVCVLWWHASVPYMQTKSRQQATYLCQNSVHWLDHITRSQIRRNFRSLPEKIYQLLTQVKGQHVRSSWIESFSSTKTWVSEHRGILEALIHPQL